MTLSVLLEAKAELDAIHRRHELEMMRCQKYRIKYRTVEALKKRREERIARFGKFIAPVIRQMPEVGLMDQLVAVQPMQGPDPGLLYLDIVHGAPLFGNLDDGLVRGAAELLNRGR